MPNYQNGKIYKIICLITGEMYIGSTTQTLSLRKGQHIDNNKHWKKGKGNRLTSFTILDRGAYRFELIELFPCNSKEELYAREGHHIRSNVCVNRNTPGRTPEMAQIYQDEYRKNHKEENKIYKKKYREDNNEKLKEINIKYYNENKDKIMEYREANRDKILRQKRENAAKHRVSKYTCACGSCLSSIGKIKHEKTTKHINFILANQN